MEDVHELQTDITPISTENIQQTITSEGGEIKNAENVSGCLTASSTPCKPAVQSMVINDWPDGKDLEIISSTNSNPNLIDLQTISMIQSEVYKDIRSAVEKRVDQLFKDFDDKVEVLVEAKLMSSIKLVKTRHFLTLIL